ncbi:Hypothetical predicted protein [Podarcis lilfordi]|uniref:C-type lectin domain-containing protein n=1 Tax=Podarcis lilfordi TaxID=74358 RepID=A0AA35P0N4_9SAUR|nr:Hypothetical predicted protein [Podarcis lilfordi]
MERGEIEESILAPSPPPSSSEERREGNEASRLRKFHLEEPTGNETETNRWRLKPSIVLNVVFFIFIIILLAVVLSNRTEQTSCNPVFAEYCPYNWTGFRNKCYYFSEEEGDWNSSYDFCVSNNASLARIEEDEKAYCKLHDMKRSYWIGIQPGMGETRKWLNGDTATMKVIGTGKCAYWKAQDDNATASRCTSAHQWICSISVKSKNHDEI